MTLYESIFAYVLKKHEKSIRGHTAFFLFSNYFTPNLFHPTQEYSFTRYMTRKYFILKNFLLHDQSSAILIENILNVFGATQRLYFALIRFKRISLMKCKKFLDTQLDLNFNDLYNIPTKHKINIIHQHTKYQFYIVDLIRIINASLSYEIDFFPDPKTIKNPWNNKPFTKSDLYNIYFFIKYSNINMPLLFLRFFQSNFCLKHFEIHNQYIIKNHIIENCHNLDDICKHRYICSMLSFYNNSTLTIKHGIYISNIFPRTRMIEIFGKYIKLYLLSIYSYEYDIRMGSQSKLIRELREFKHMNPSLGKNISCMNIAKLFYISKLVYDNKDYILTPLNYIPHPSMIFIKKKSFCIDYQLKGDFTYFPTIDQPNIRKCNQVDIKELFRFVKEYKFSDHQYILIRELYSPLIKALGVSRSQHVTSDTVIYSSLPLRTIDDNTIDDNTIDDNTIDDNTIDDVSINSDMTLEENSRIQSTTPVTTPPYIRHIFDIIVTADHANNDNGYMDHSDYNLDISDLSD